MRCFIPVGPGQLTIMMLFSANLLLAFYCLIQVDAARPPEQRRQHDALYLPLPPVYGHTQPVEPLSQRTFTLQQIHHFGINKHPNLHRYIDIPSDASLKVTSDYGATYEDAPTSLRVNAVSTNVQRLVRRSKADMDEIFAYHDHHGTLPDLPSSAWTIDQVPGPNTTDKETILSFARMAANAYVQEHDMGDWIPVGGGFNYTDDFGWEADGLRGHVFADQTNSTVVIGLKGTSPAVFDGVDTTGNDKLNDNLFGSCCCGQGGQIMWKQVCECMTSAYTCNNTCLVKSLRQKSHYYWAARDLYHNVTERYPDAEVWLSGHSLGGVVSSLLGLTYGLPTITYESFPDALAADRLGLPTPPGYQIGSHQSRFDIPIHHFGHTADPIYMGVCNAATSFCSIAGYAFQGVCHTGKTCTYDTVSDLGWRVGIGTHKIVNVIKDVLEKYDTVPSCEEDIDCHDCFNWKFFESNSSEPITTSSSIVSSTRTRTETCKTPGWWGCLDESSTTTGTASSSSSTSSSSTSTCRTPGWFGCKDPTTTTSSATSSASTSSPRSATATTTTSSSTTCLSPGWLGCNDPTPTTIAAPSSTFVYATATPTSTEPHPTDVPSTRLRCAARYWYGVCRSWSEQTIRFARNGDLR